MNLRVEELTGFANGIEEFQYTKLFPDEGEAWNRLNEAVKLVKEAAGIIAAQDDKNQAVEVNP